MRSAWAVAALVSGLVACGFYDAVPSPTTPFVPDIGLPDAGLPNLPDGGFALPDGGFQLPDGGLGLPDGGFGLPDGGFGLPDGGFGLPDGGCIGTACVPQVVASGEGEPMGIALGATDVYWVDLQASALRRIPKVGGTATTVLHAARVQAPLAVDGQRAYLVTTQEGMNTLVEVGLGDGSVTVRASGSMGTLSVDDLVQSETALFAETPEGLVQVDKRSGGAQLRLSPGARRGLAADLSGVYFADEQPPQLLHLAASSGTLTYRASVPQGTRLTALHVSRGVFATLQPLTQDPDACAGSELSTLGLGGGELVGLADSPGCAVSLATDRDHLYWLAVVPGRGSLVLRVPLQGGQRQLLAESGGQGWSLAVDESHVYWSERTTGRILRVQKPQ